MTKADKEASAAILKALAEFTPNIPIVSEEEPFDKNQDIVRTSETYWVTDPLDGTRTYVNGYDGFGVHIALVHKGEPVMGVAYFPAQDILYFTGDDGKAYQMKDVSNPKSVPEEITVREKKALHYKIWAAVGWNKKQDIEKIGDYTVEPIRAVGGARLCITAAGETEVASMHTPFSYWDVAAGHAILKAAGGELIEFGTGTPVRYDDDSLIANPSFGASKGVLGAVFKGAVPYAPKVASGIAPDKPKRNSVPKPPKI